MQAEAAILYLIYLWHKKYKIECSAFVGIVPVFFHYLKPDLSRNAISRHAEPNAVWLVKRACQRMYVLLPSGSHP